MIPMPGESHSGALPPLTGEEAALAEALRAHVQKLAGGIGPRTVGFYDGLNKAVDHIESSLRAAGCEVSRQPFQVSGRTVFNLEVETRGISRPEEIVVIGAHYDTAGATPGANDNGSGVAALLSLARRFAGRSHARTVRWVAFVNEEPPYFQTSQMGSVVYARRCRERNENIVAMLSLETIGCYFDEPGTQRYPFPLSLFYPSTGNFIAFVGNVDSRALVRQAIGAFRAQAKFPSEGAALHGWLPGIGWSDHWAFWQEGYPAIMVTDTALFRYPHYHDLDDTPDKIDYERTARVVNGLEKVVGALLQAGD